jgi:hypothetical protein
MTDVSIAPTTSVDAVVDNMFDRALLTLVLLAIIFDVRNADARMLPPSER